MFRVFSAPSSGVHKTVVTTTGTSHVSERCGLKSVKSSQGRVSTSLVCHDQIRTILTDFNPHYSDT